MKKYLFALLVGCCSCSKQEGTTPVSPISTTTIPTTNPTTLGCRIDTQVQTPDGQSIKFVYDKDGYISKAEIGLVGSSAAPYNNYYSYKDQQLIAITAYSNVNLVPVAYEEAYEYTNGALSKITIINSPTEKNHYTITLESDANKRIIKMEDSNGLINVLKRDDKGNLIEVRQTQKKDNVELFRIVRSDFDNKKSFYELLKGWQFDVFTFYGDYMKVPFFTLGASGNPKKMQVFKNGNLFDDVEYSYEYAPNGYPTKISTYNKFSKITQTDVFTYLSCN